MSEKFPATLMVHTPSGLVYCCDDHAAKLHSLMQFLGAHAAVYGAPDGKTCSNCENEAKAKEAP